MSSPRDERHSSSSGDEAWGDVLAAESRTQFPTFQQAREDRHYHSSRYARPRSFAIDSGLFGASHSTPNLVPNREELPLPPVPRIPREHRGQVVERHEEVQRPSSSRPEPPHRQPSGRNHERPGLAVPSSSSQHHYQRPHRYSHNLLDLEHSEDEWRQLEWNRQHGQGDDRMQQIVGDGLDDATKAQIEREVKEEMHRRGQQPHHPDNRFRLPERRPLPPPPVPPFAQGHGHGLQQHGSFADLRYHRNQQQHLPGNTVYAGNAPAASHLHYPGPRERADVGMWRRVFGRRRAPEQHQHQQQYVEHPTFNQSEPTEPGENQRRRKRDFFLGRSRRG
ncbi:hypothetical protein JCM6882_002643 [Rhodosporidiobolus microsporus]